MCGRPQQVQKHLEAFFNSTLKSRGIFISEHISYLLDSVFLTQKIEPLTGSLFTGCSFGKKYDNECQAATLLGLHNKTPSLKMQRYHSSFVL